LAVVKSAAPGSSDARSGAPTARPTGNPASAVYGTVLAGSLIAVEGSRDDVDVKRLVIVVVATQCVYWLAHVYAELVGRRIGTRQRPFRGEIRELLRDDWPLVAASFGPLIAIVLTRAGGADADTAVRVGLWVNAVVLAGWAVFAGRRAKLHLAELVLYVAVSFAFGVALVLLKVLLH